MQSIGAPLGFIRMNSSSSCVLVLSRLAPAMRSKHESCQTRWAAVVRVLTLRNPKPVVSPHPVPGLPCEIGGRGPEAPYPSGGFEPQGSIVLLLSWVNCPQTTAVYLHAPPPEHQSCQGDLA